MAFVCRFTSLVIAVMAASTLADVPVAAGH